MFKDGIPINKNQPFGTLHLNSKNNMPQAIHKLLLYHAPNLCFKKKTPQKTTMAVPQQPWSKWRMTQIKIKADAFETFQDGQW